MAIVEKRVCDVYPNRVKGVEKARVFLRVGEKRMLWDADVCPLAAVRIQRAVVRVLGREATLLDSQQAEELGLSNV